MHDPPGSHDAPTLRQVSVPIALLVAGSPQLTATVTEAALNVQVLVAECTLAEVATQAAQLRPLVLIMAEDLFRFDPESFTHLARDVNASLLRVRDDSVTVKALSDRLAAAMLDAEQRRGHWNDEPI